MYFNSPYEGLNQGCPRWSQCWPTGSLHLWALIPRLSQTVQLDLWSLSGRAEQIRISVFCLMLTIWWSRTAGIPCVGRSTPVFLHRPTDSWCPSQGFVLTPPPCPPPPPGLHLHGSTDKQRHRDRIKNVSVRHVHIFCHFVETDWGEE